MLQVRKYLSKKRIIVVSIVLAAIIAGGAVYLWHRPLPAETTVGQRKVITYSTDKPSETPPPKDTFAWQGKASDPKYIELPAIAAEGHVQLVGIDQHKAVAVPNNVHVAGWFVNSVQPGKTGLSIIDGHVDGRRDEGIFKNLLQLKADDKFVVTLGNDEQRTFRVKRVSSVKTAEAPAVLFSQDPTISRQLNLITCGGTFDRDSRSYDQRVIVVAELVS